MAIARGLLSASPMHMIMHELCASEQFFYRYVDARDALERLAERIMSFYEAALECTLQCDAEAVLWGANYDQDLTWPAFFSDQITPWLQHASERLHSAGKVMFTHCDGENDAVTELLLESGADVAESICPAPMTKLGLAGLRGRWGTTVAICGGIPSGTRDPPGKLVEPSPRNNRVLVSSGAGRPGTPSLPRLRWAMAGWFRGPSPLGVIQTISPRFMSMAVIRP